MADIFVSPDYSDSASVKQTDVGEIISLGKNTKCCIYGKMGTSCLVRNGVDAIASIGYACQIDLDSLQDTLSQILNSFQESKIGDLKKQLVGQYVLVIKKEDKLYIFADSMGVRNIFYSNDGTVISSSFSAIETFLGTNEEDLSVNKVFEFLAMRHVMYPTWLGCTTGHRRINWLLPYEYLVFDVKNASCRIGSVVSSFDNGKLSDCTLLAAELLSRLKAIMNRREFEDASVAASLTGGRDSRLVAAIAAEHFRNIRFRTAVSSERLSSSKDLEIAERIARIRGIPLDIFRFNAGRDKDRFIEITEGFTPAFNHSITPLIDSSGSYSLGFGGVYGTELFMAITSNSIDEYVESAIERAKKALRAEDDFWDHFRESLHDEFKRVKDHFKLRVGDERDYIRLFNLLVTVRYSSFILLPGAENRFHIDQRAA